MSRTPHAVTLTSAAAWIVLGIAIAQVGRAADNDAREVLRDVVLHAGGVVEFQRPPDWQLSEMPAGREVRLVLVHDDDQGRGRGTAEFWITFHAQRGLAAASPQQLGQWLTRRAQQLGGDPRTPGTIRRRDVGGRPGLVQPYSAGEPRQSTIVRSGQHVAVASEWGILELHWQSDAVDRARHEQAAAELLDSVRFHKPLEQPLVAIQASAASARPILGSWKAYRSRMTLKPDGGILIQPDAKRIRLGRDPLVQPRPIVGQFESRDDLLMVVWNDGSRLNLRWALYDGTLLLTDHNGQITKLNPLLD